jgi:hypothetical protein
LAQVRAKNHQNPWLPNQVFALLLAVVPDPVQLDMPHRWFASLG